MASVGQITELTLTGRSWTKGGKMAVQSARPGHDIYIIMEPGSREAGDQVCEPVLSSLGARLSGTAVTDFDLGSDCWNCSDRSECSFPDWNSWCLTISPRQPFAQEADVAAIGPPHHVEGIAEDWYRTDESVDRDTGQHTRNDVQRRAQLTRLMHDIERDRGGDRIANARNQPDYCIEAESHIGARQNEGRVQERRQRI